MKWRFAGVFLSTFTALLILWWLLDIGQWYRTAVLGLAQWLSPLVNGWLMEIDQPNAPDPVLFVNGSRQLAMLLQLPALSMALIPLISLIVATPSIGWRRGFTTAAKGSGIFFLIHVGIVLLYPWLLDRPDLLKDTIGVFSGLVGFVLGPLGLWFVLTYPVLRPLWRIES